METKVVQIKVKSCAPYAKGWQVNAFVGGEESEITYYGVTKKVAEQQAIKEIEKFGKLPHAPYKPEGGESI